jgi:hypothetical protein
MSPVSVFAIRRRMLVQFDSDEPLRVDVISSRRIPGASTGLALLAMTTLGGCHSESSSTPLAPELAAIQCPADRAEHASTLFRKARLTFVCVDKRLSNDPTLLRCDLDSRPMVCEDAGQIILRHDAAGVVSSGPLPAELQEKAAPGAGPTDNSELEINFRNGPPPTHTFDAVETNWRFLLADGRDLLPPGFTFVKGTLCDRSATVLQNGVCNLEATTPSLYWNIAVSIRHKEGTPISAGEYRTELAFWMKYLGLMVVDPKE